EHHSFYKKKHKHHHKHKQRSQNHSPSHNIDTLKQKDTHQPYRSNEKSGSIIQSLMSFLPFRSNSSSVQMSETPLVSQQPPHHLIQMSSQKITEKEEQKEIEKEKEQEKEKEKEKEK